MSKALFGDFVMEAEVSGQSVFPPFDRGSCGPTRVAVASGERSIGATTLTLI
jgi:hypothetical protein